MAETEKFLGQVIFESWLIKQKKLKIKKSADQYSKYLVNIWKDENISKCKKIHNDSSDESIKSAITTIEAFYNKINKSGINYLTAAIYFAKNGYECYSYTILDFTRSLIDLAKLKENNSSLFTYLNRFQLFIDAVVKKPSIIKTQWANDNSMEESMKQLTPLCAKKNLHKIDGVMSLATELGEKKFIQMAIEGCYFLNSDMVKTRFDDLSKRFRDKFKDENGEIVPIPARKTTKEDGQPEGHLDEDKNHFIVDDLEIPVIIDSNGNQQVCSLINKATGYYHQTGKDNIFQNYIISHIWGHAYDPRYFTNWWNVVLVPAWANGLLDKENCPKGSLASKFRATIMKICYVLYQENLFNNDEDTKQKWDYMKMNPKIMNSDDIIANLYTINILENGDQTSSGTRVGTISHKIISRDDMSIEKTP